MIYLAVLKQKFHSTSDFSFSILLSLFSLVTKTESNSGQEIVEAIKVGHNGGILGCDARYKTECQTGPWEKTKKNSN